MEELIREAAKSAPNIVVLAAIVWMFLKSNASIAKTTEKHQAARDLQYRSLYEEHLDARALTRAAVKENSIILENNSKAIIQLSNSIRELMDRK